LIEVVACHYPINYPITQLPNYPITNLEGNIVVGKRLIRHILRARRGVAARRCSPRRRRATPRPARVPHRPRAARFRSPRISVVYRLLPSLSSHVRRLATGPRRRSVCPSSGIRRATRPALPHSTTRCHSVFFLPLAGLVGPHLCRRHVDRRHHGARWAYSAFSASRPRFPTRITLLTEPIEFLES